MPTKSDYLQDKKLSPADELRTKLSELERVHLKISTMDAVQALALLHDLDWVKETLSQFEAAGVDLRSEEGRFQAVQGRIKNKIVPLLRAIGGAAALSQRRPAPPWPSEQWWWYIDEMVAAHQRRLLRRVGIGLLIVLLIGGGIILALNTVLAPSPEAVARMEAENGAYKAVDQADYQGALSAVNAGLAKVPGDVGLLIFKGVLQQDLGQKEQAAQSFEQAQKILNNPREFFLARGQIYVRLNQAQAVEQDARSALALDDKFARSWLMLGQALEMEGKIAEALDAYDTASNLALESGENEIYVMARVATARLTQMAPAMLGTPTITEPTTTPGT